LLFFNDLQIFQSTHNVDGLAAIADAIELNKMIKILLMLYADDAVLFSEFKERVTM
jgi:hypothetical protein